MRGRIFSPVLVLLLAAFFAFVARSVIEVKILELRAGIQRDRILNLELSSRALEARSRRLSTQREDFRAEIRQSVLESSLLNDERPKALEPGLLEYTGYVAVNTARLLSLKPLVHLISDTETLVLLRYAFYMERNRRYEAAIQRYRDLLTNRLFGTEGDLDAFVSLHLGYCLMAVGRTDEAAGRLRVVRETYAGTHFATTAAVLLHVLEDGRRRRERIHSRTDSPLALARELFQSGQCPAALRAYEQAATHGSLQLLDRYRRALCLEETGRVGAATTEYRNIISTYDTGFAPGGIEAARLSNRRLLILGHFYAGDPELRSQAEIEAKRLGDATALGEIVEVAEEMQPAQIVEEIQKPDGPAPDLLNSLRDELASATGPAAPEREGTKPEPVPAEPSAQDSKNAQETAANRHHLTLPARAVPEDPERIRLSGSGSAGNAAEALTRVMLGDGSVVRVSTLEHRSGKSMFISGPDARIHLPVARIRRIVPPRAGEWPGLIEVISRKGGTVRYFTELSFEKGRLIGRLPAGGGSVPVALEEVHIIRTP